MLGAVLDYRLFQYFWNHLKMSRPISFSLLLKMSAELKVGWTLWKHFFMIFQLGSDYDNH